MSQESLFGGVIHHYSRAQAIADGVLVDVSNSSLEVGFRIPVAMTAAVWTDCVAWEDEDSIRQTTQDEPGRLLDVLWLARLAAKNVQDSRLAFDVRRVPRDGHSVYPRPVTLHMAIGPGDAGEPVITLMMPDEE